ncbi:transposase [Xanthomonas arboricola]|jgi:putative transposase|uniref:transposase n=1 Tax=Xanthomonas arboricola TaxID=56448 RepID=UPI001E3E8713|nr:transposase [Xanthomonas arboricola]MCC8473718.1 transposase [Xanthomonas arboricola]
MAAMGASAHHEKDAPFLLFCIEFNPLRVRLPADPAAYRWSSCPANLGQRGHSALTPHHCWLALGSKPIERCKAYRTLLDEALSDDLLASIHLHLQQQRALGHDAFRAMVEALRVPSPLIGHVN